MYGPEFKLSEETIELRDYIGACITKDRGIIEGKIDNLLKSNRYFHIDGKGLVRFYKENLYNEIAELIKYDMLIKCSSFDRQSIRDVISKYERYEIEPYYEVLVGNKSFKKADPEGLCMFYEIVEEDLEEIYPDLEKRLANYIYNVFDRLSEYVHTSAFITEEGVKRDRDILLAMYPKGYLDLKHI